MEELKSRRKCTIGLSFLTSSNNFILLEIKGPSRGTFSGVSMSIKEAEEVRDGLTKLINTKLATFED